MNDVQWTECRLLQPMLQYLRGRASIRKLRLFAVACCRRIEQYLVDDRSRKAIQISECVADAIASKPELREASSAAWQAVGSPSVSLGVLVSAARAAARTADEEPFDAAIGTSIEVKNGFAEEAESRASELATGLSEEIWFQAEAEEIGFHCNLIREVIGNPFRSVSVDPRWLTSNVVDLAKAIYDEKAFDRMPILNDALMDAGCDSEEILSHCRSSGSHCRGCWVIDMVMGKK